MASVSIASVRSLSEIPPSVATDIKLGTLVGVSGAVFYSLTKKDLGHAIESIVQVGSDAHLTIYGHLLGMAGDVYLLGCGDSIDGEQEFRIVDQDTIKILGVTLSGSESLGRLFQKRVFDCNLNSGVIQITPSPVYRVKEVRVSSFDGTPDFGDSSIVVDLADVDIVQTGSTFKSELELKNPFFSSRRRVTGFINQQLVTDRKMARVTYFSGLDKPPPYDLQHAISSAAKEILAGGGSSAGEFNSESIDYYSYSRASLQDLKDYPFSTLSTFLRYQ